MYLLQENVLHFKNFNQTVNNQLPISSKFLTFMCLFQYNLSWLSFTNITSGPPRTEACLALDNPLLWEQDKSMTMNPIPGKETCSSQTSHNTVHSSEYFQCSALVINSL